MTFSINELMQVLKGNNPTETNLLAQFKQKLKQDVIDTLESCENPEVAYEHVLKLRVIDRFFFELEQLGESPSAEEHLN
jgi:hypothetical protein